MLSAPQVRRSIATCSWKRSDLSSRFVEVWMPPAGMSSIGAFSMRSSVGMAADRQDRSRYPTSTCWSSAPSRPNNNQRENALEPKQNAAGRPPVGNIFLAESRSAGIAVPAANVSRVGDNTHASARADDDAAADIYRAQSRRRCECAEDIFHGHSRCAEAAGDVRAQP